MKRDVVAPLLLALACLFLLVLAVILVQMIIHAARIGGARP